jgi:hypothetical protein
MPELLCGVGGGLVAAAVRAGRLEESIRRSDGAGLPRGAVRAQLSPGGHEIAQGRHRPK